MPQFTTISPTHIAGKKPEAWKRFLEGGYIAIGWMHVDVSGKSEGEIAQLLEEEEFDNVQSGVDAFKRFFALRKGDYVAVNNASNGLFGVGIVASDYRFKRNIHNSSAEDESAWYSHYREVEWKHTDYVRRVDLIREGETAWQPYGTIGAICSEVPPYIKRLLGQEPLPEKPQNKTSPPEELQNLLKSIKALRGDKSHQERAHESLVEDFFTILGYEKHVDITYRQGFVDLGLRAGNRQLAVVEVKRDWDFSESLKETAVGQAYRYAHERGVRYVIVTNGDAYYIFDRLKGLSYDSNFLGEFRLSVLDDDALRLIERLRKEHLGRPALKELFTHIAESFPADSEAAN